MKKQKIFLILSLILGTTSSLAGAYTLQEICEHYNGNAAKCGGIPFCKAKTTQAGCKLNPAYYYYGCEAIDDEDSCNSHGDGGLSAARFCQWSSGGTTCQAKGYQLEQF